MTVFSFQFLWALLAQTDALPVAPPTDGGVSRTSRLVLGDYFFVVGIGLLLGVFFIFLIWLFQAGPSSGKRKGRTVIGNASNPSEGSPSGSRRRKRRKKSRKPRFPTLAEKETQSKEGDVEVKE